MNAFDPLEWNKMPGDTVYGAPFRQKLSSVASCFFTRFWVAHWNNAMPVHLAIM